MSSRISFFSATPLEYGGGYEAFVTDAVAQMMSDGIDAEIIVPPLRQFKRIVQSLGLGQRFAHVVKDNNGCAHYVERLRRASRLYVKNEPLDIVWVRMLGAWKQPVVGFHTPLETESLLRDAFYRSAAYRRLLRGSTLHFLSRSQVPAWVIGQPYFVVPNGVEVPPLESSVQTSVLRLIFVGRMTRQKGIDLLNAALRSIDVPFVCSVFGDGEMADCARALEAAGLAKYYGAASRSRILGEMKHHDIILMPSRWENQPLAALEALAQGTIPISSRIGPFAELLAEYPELQVDYEQPASVAQAVRYIYGMKFAEREKLRAGLHEIAKRFDKRVVFRQLAVAIIESSDVQPRRN